MTLDQLAIKHGTDKSSKHHNYCHVYEQYFEKRRHAHFSLLELGYGGYDHADRGGQSAKMWLEYFTAANIIVTDKFQKINTPVSQRFDFRLCSQDDEAGLRHLLLKHNPLIVIDDASHINPLTIKSFEIIFPLLQSGSIYVIEDTETSYWEEVATDGTDFKGTRNTFNLYVPSVMNYFKLLADEINLKEDIMISSIHFYKGLIFILKK